MTGRLYADHDCSESEVTEIAYRLHAAGNDNRSNYAPKLALRLPQILSERDELRKALAIKPKKTGARTTSVAVDLALI